MVGQFLVGLQEVLAERERPLVDQVAADPGIFSAAPTNGS
jgi:hypothetical protein